MTNYAIDDGNGNQLSAGLQEWNARKVARRTAQLRGESVFLYVCDARERDGDDADDSEEFAPLSVETPDDVRELLDAAYAHACETWTSADA